MEAAPGKCLPLSRAIPPQTYSDSARRKFKSWQEQLTPTPPTPKP
jgi:hypothetical protein